MLLITLRQMRTGWARLVAAGIAILLGTGFITATMIAGEVMKSTAHQSLTSSYAGAGLVVTPAPGNDDTSGFTDEDLTSLAEVEGVRDVANTARVFAILDSTGHSQAINIGPASAHDDTPLVTGALPASDREIALATNIAQYANLEVGDVVPVDVVGLESGEDFVSSTFTLSGVFEDQLDFFGLTDTAIVSEETFNDPVFTPMLDQGPVTLTLDPGADPDTVLARVDAALGGGFDTATVEDVAESRMESFSGQTDIMRNLLLAFAGIALAVAVLVIANTFSVLVATRTHQLALLRTVGASRGQVRGSVLAEALILGLIASFAGVGLGYAIIAGAIALLSGSVSPAIDMWQGFALTSGVVITAVLTGLVLTLVSGWLPARAATQVRPLEALRPTPAKVGVTAGKFRAVVSAVSFVSGALMLIAAVRFALGEDNVGIALLLGIPGGFLTVVGIVLGSVFVITPVVRIVGAAFGRSVPATVATMDAVRNPRRTATTTNALFIGVALVMMMATGAASAKSTFDSELSDMFPIDVRVIGLDTGEGTALTEAQADAAGSMPAVESLTAMSSLTVEFSATGPFEVLAPATSLPGVDQAGPEAFLTEHERFTDLGEGEVLLPEWMASAHELSAGDPLDLTDGTTPLTVAGTTSLTEAILTTPATLDSLGSDGSASSLWIDLNPEADATEAVKDIEHALADTDGPTVSVESPAVERQAFNQIIDTLLLVVVAMLAVAIVIALVGVANTLSLSVLERRRESATLRALGLTTGQLRGMLAIEGVIIALVGALAGAAGGLLYGWAGVSTILGSLGTVERVVPWGVLAAVLVTALAAGLIASVLPARSAVRVSPVAALAEK